MFTPPKLRVAKQKKVDAVEIPGFAEILIPPEIARKNRAKFKRVSQWLPATGSLFRV